MKIPTSNAIMPLNKKNNAYLMLTPEGESYFPPVLVREKGEKIELALCDNEDISENKKLSLSDVLFEGDLSTKFYVKTSDLDRVFGTESEEVIPKLINLFDQYHRIDSEGILSLIAKLQEKYSVDDVILNLESFTERDINELVLSEDRISLYEELLKNYDDYGEESDLDQEGDSIVEKQHTYINEMDEDYDV